MLSNYYVVLEMAPGLFQLLLVVLLVLLLFGAGKLPKVMSDIGKGIKNLRDSLNADNKSDSDKKDDQK